MDTEFSQLCTDALAHEMVKEPDLWRCTVCGRIGTVGRCCGEETRERANMEQLLAENERLDEGWSELALEWLRVYAATAQLPTGELESFTIEQARAWIGEHAALPEGVDARAWGAVTRRAVRLGYIEATGGYAPAARSHGSPRRLYRRGSRA